MPLPNLIGIEVLDPHMSLAGIKRGQYKDLRVVRNGPYPVLVLNSIDRGDRFQGVQQIDVGLYILYDFLQDDHDLVPSDQYVFYHTAEANFRFKLCVVLVPEIKNVWSLMGVLRGAYDAD